MIDKELVKQAIKRVLADRSFMWLAILLLVGGIVYGIIVALNIHPSDVTVYSRYTAFGEAHFYKSHWQYLLGFVVFGLVVSIAHVSLMIKLYAIERRQTALLVGSLGIMLLILSFVYTTSVIGLGYAA